MPSTLERIDGRIEMLGSKNFSQIAVMIVAGK
jgi:hypothetical protein